MKTDHSSLVTAFISTWLRKSLTNTESTLSRSTSTAAAAFFLGRSGGRRNIIVGSLPRREFGSFVVPSRRRSHLFHPSSTVFFNDNYSFSTVSSTENKMSSINESEDENVVKEEPTTPSPYEEIVRKLYMTNLFHPVKLGLKNIEDLHGALGSPTDDPKVCIIHIAGTNGKGSVAYKLAKTLEAAGNTVGLFSSPHVSSFRERMQVNSTLISEEDVQTLLPRIYEECQERNIPATFFEITTALAFLFYSQENANVIVLETGLGGRLDATNVVKKVALSVITSIGLEHTRILGDTIELIAREKCGIMKEGCPVLVGPNVPMEVMRECAETKAVDAFYTCEEVLDEKEDGDDFDYDVENSNIAKAAIQLLTQRVSQHRRSKETGDVETWMDNIHLPTPTHIQNGMAQRPPCRFEVMRIPLSSGDEASTSNVVPQVTVILDVGHNPPAMEHLVHKFQSSFPQNDHHPRDVIVVAGFSSDKDVNRCIQSLLSIVSSSHENDDSLQHLHLVEASHPRATKIEQMIEKQPKLQSSRYDLSDRGVGVRVKDALDQCSNIIQRRQRQTTVREDDVILIVCGSVFLMAEAREALGIREPKDSDYISEMAGANMKHNQENFGNKVSEYVQTEKTASLVAEK